MSENKTHPTDRLAQDLIGVVENKSRQKAALELLPLFEEWTGLPPIVWGDGLAGKETNGIIGFGRYRYEYKSGRTGEYFLTGFSPRKANMVVYIMPGFDSFQEQLARIGPHKHSVSCLYFTKLDAIDLDALREMVQASCDTMKQNHEWWPK